MKFDLNSMSHWSVTYESREIERAKPELAEDDGQMSVMVGKP